MTPTSADRARRVVAALAAAGVREVVLCPGSRSAPLAYALHAADAAGALRLHVRHDERSAAFTALGVGVAGLAGGTGSPAAVVTTSGTAAANLHPAVLEAAEAGVPLLAITADRPARLRGTWANQTTALQAGVFGGAVRLALDVPAEAAGATWEAAVADAVGAARGAGGDRPGPVHLDLAFDDPLVPDGPWDAAGSLVAVRPPDAAPAAPLDAAAVLAQLHDGGPALARTVVVAGHAADARLGALARELAARAGWPLLAEPSSGARAGDHAVGPHRLLAGAPGLGAAAERVVVVGRPTLSRPVSRLLARPGVDVVQVVAHPGEAGPERGPARRLAAVPGGAGEALAASVPAPEGDWLAAWRAAGRAAARAVAAVLDAEAAAGRLPGPFVARALAAALGSDDVLVAASSNAVRDLDLAAEPWAVGGAPLVLASRGLAGIDGTVSTAGGAALATGRPTRVLIGDLALLHDANGLLVPPGEPEPDLQVVVVDDDGGGIFTGLEHGEPSRAPTFERLFATPHGLDPAAVCAALGAAVTRADDPASLAAALAAPPRGRSVVHVRVDRSGLRALHARIADAVAAALPGA